MDSEGPTKGQFATLFRATYLDVFRFAAWLTSGDLSWAEDITAETYKRAWERRQGLDGRPKRAMPWLLTIARNLYVDGYRDSRNFATVNPGNLTLLAAGQRSPENEQIRREEARELWKLVSQLPLEHREFLVLRYVLDWRVKDIAKRFRKKPNTVSVSLKRILSTLKTRWRNSQTSSEAE